MHLEGSIEKYICVTSFVYNVLSSLKDGDL